MQAILSRFSHAANDARNLVIRAAPQCQALTDHSGGVFQRVSAEAEALSSRSGQIVVSLQSYDNVSQRVD
jgi:hypothetical protein